MTTRLSMWRGKINQRPVAVCNEVRHRKMPESVMQIVELVAFKHGLFPRDIIGQDRTKAAAHARFEAMARVRKEIVIAGGEPSLPLIGSWFGGRDHTTVLYSIRRYEEIQREAQNQAEAA